MSQELYNVSVLLVEDDENCVEELLNLLKRIVVKVVLARDGKSGLEAFMSDKFDLVITDIRMPNIDGLAMASKIKAVSPKTCIIVTSAFHDEKYLLQSISLGVCDFLFKPVEVTRLYAAVGKCVAQIRQTRKDIASLQENQIQNEQAFDKQLLGINDKICCRKFGKLLFDASFRPAEELSGDCYGAINIGEDGFLLYIIDAMHSGLSASITAMQSAAFLGNIIESEQKNGLFDLRYTINEYQKFIKRQIFADEAVCAIFIYIDEKTQKMYFSNFGMPPLLVQQSCETARQIQCNNLPITRYERAFSIDDLDFSQIVKLAIASDGVRDGLAPDGKHYGDHLLDDFAASHSKNELLRMVDEKKLLTNDDFTLVFVRRLPECIQKVDFDATASFEGIESGIERIFLELSEYDMCPKEHVQYQFALNELMFNALEHGLLGISFDQKRSLLESGEYENSVLEMIMDGKTANMSIGVSVEKYGYSSGQTVSVCIKDGGEGFDVSEVVKKLRYAKNRNVNGRGIAMSCEVSDGVYYNQKGNEVFVLKHFMREKL